MRPTILASRPAALLAATALLLTFATPIRAEDKIMDRLITVSATGYAYAEPDQARLSAGVTAEADTAEAALSANTELMKKVVDGLKENGVDAKDIQTSNFHVEPRYTNPRDGTPPVINGYRVSNQVSILARDLKGLGGLLDKLITLDANQVHGLDFEVSKAETLKDEARKEAVANARRRAELLAAAAGAEVGEVVTIAEETGYGAPRPMAARMAKAEAAPIEAGTETLEARVTVTWKLK
ncbi:SIMPL domain-containing protein [Hyphomicrobium sp.]|uniref:SIMPL domain-containing protein n=1 Tax=Hyphomicrobium sp. TaxID=82 RepID=UPI0025BA0EE8|nr:SIMPL domain-containing protein [Hyphomicrobium sp.]MCC7253709.1 SIMPL domain-containing protein [Hyphomicrobium sp.]